MLPQDPFGSSAIPKHLTRPRFQRPKKPKRLAYELPSGASFLVDTNEYAGDHKGYDLEPRIEKKLLVGDYSICDTEGRSLEGQVAVERKSLVNLVGDCAGENRERFERCLERLAALEYSALVVEAGWRQIAAGGYPFSRMHPSSVLGSVIAWSVRFGVHVWMVGNREEGAQLTARLLARFLQEASDGKEQAEGGGSVPC